jgi:hypothetical protein
MSSFCMFEVFAYCLDLLDFMQPKYNVTFYFLLIDQICPHFSKQFVHIYKFKLILLHA